MESHPELNFKSQANGTLKLQLSGAWTLESVVPDTAGLTEKIGAARSLRILADYLEQHPDALIKGKGYERR